MGPTYFFYSSAHFLLIFEQNKQIMTDTPDPVHIFVQVVHYQKQKLRLKLMINCCVWFVLPIFEKNSHFPLLLQLESFTIESTKKTLKS